MHVKADQRPGEIEEENKMGYFSEMSVVLQEQRDLFTDQSALCEGDQPSRVQTLFWRLEDLKDRLKELVEADGSHGPSWERPPRDWRKVYRDWPEYWVSGNPEAFYVLPRDLDSIADVLRAIAGTQKRLFFCGHDADAEEEKRGTRRAASRLEGQTALPLAS